MRQGQQKRMRGRNRGSGGGGGGKGPNPLSRTFESNGPDVKVRGTAAHIAEKYVQLARDAQSSGDPILAEAYLQHAEHYFRVIAASQPQFNGQPTFGQAQEEEDDGEDLEFDGPIPSLPQGFGQGGQHGGEEQPPRFQQQPRERPFNDRPHYQDRQGQSERGGFGDRHDGERPHDRGQGDRFRGERFGNDRPPRSDRIYEGSSPAEVGDDNRGFTQRHPRRDRRFGERPYGERPERPQFQDRSG